jgi:hypothetical protein
MEKLSAPSEYKKYAKEKELTTWLSHHNPEIALKHKNRAQGKEYERSLLSGLKFERKQSQR